ncbi:transcriptional regulator [Acrocarpospora pleiomorpha]|uniref:Transcriptional regulator n=1 Tax=Acrocarpospora pleiomorpha TaxID=90975 RepID=A0A5M3XR47_9ACTN|nr:DUF2087 domain-containing protein [Acrocarpospora pleiomorpha]GES23704.1 transcriptional regulator [Acrocarpospora pleiomorpha]
MTTQGSEISDDVLERFLVRGRLITMPAKQSIRRAVLDRIAASFQPGVRYPETEVNEILRAFYDDYAALRRYLIDGDFLSRENNVYWRSGGTVS